MARHPSDSAKPLPREQRAAKLRKLVKSGRITDRQAGMVDLRDLTLQERQLGDDLTRRNAGKAAAS